MAKDTASETSGPQAPAPLSPSREQVVDGTSVTFTWEGVEDASEYKLEVASSPQFEELVLEERSNDEELTLKDVLPTDGSTFYWRVLNETEDGWQGLERIESFISTTPEEAAAIKEDEKHRPEEDEDLGPTGGLVGAAAEDVSATVRGDEAEKQRLRREQEMGVAEEGIQSGQIFAIVAVVTAAVFIIVFVLFFWVDNVTRSARDAVIGVSGYPELQSVEMEATRRLDQYEAVDPDEGVYRIPIDRAIELTLQERAADEREMVPTGAGTSVRAQQNADSPN